MRTGVWLAGLFMLCFVYFLPRWHDWNQDARLDMTMAVVNHGTIAIDAYQRNTSDDDHFQGHYFSNKAPGQSLLGVPVYVAFKLALAVPPVRASLNAFERNSAWNMALQDAGCITPIKNDPCRFVLPRKLDFAMLQYVESSLTAAVPSVLMLLLFFWFLAYFSSSVLNRALLTTALGLGTMIFPYSQEFYSHVPAAALEFGAFVLIYIVGSAGRSPRVGTGWILENPPIAVFVAGFCAGLGVVFEYPAALIALLLGVYALYRLPRKQIVAFIAGALPAIAIDLAYNFAAYHNPLTTGYGCNEKLYKQECEGIGGFTLPPNGHAIFGMSADRYRGLFFLSPFLLLAFSGYALWLSRRPRDLGTPLVTLAIPVVFFFAISCYWGWYGGQVVGPRYLLPMLPFLVLPIILVLDRVRSWPGQAAIYALVALSVVNVWVETIGGLAYPSGSQHDPLFAYSFPQIFQGNFPLSLGTFLGLRGPATLIPLAIVLAVWTVALLSPFLVRESATKVVRPGLLTPE